MKLYNIAYIVIMTFSLYIISGLIGKKTAFLKHYSLIITLCLLPFSIYYSSYSFFSIFLGMTIFNETKNFIDKKTL